MSLENIGTCGYGQVPRETEWIEFCSGMENLTAKPQLLPRFHTPSVGREKNSLTVDRAHQP